jgi:hypothetical protein
MKCISCENDARAICKFCGRAVCQDHIAHRRYVTGYTTYGGIFAFSNNGLSIEDAVWCQICNPQEIRTA